MDDIWANILRFRLDCKQLAGVSLFFDVDITSIFDITFFFKGMSKLIPERYIGEITEKSQREELSILTQARSILKGRYEYKKYYEVIEERINFLLELQKLK